MAGRVDQDVALSVADSSKLIRLHESIASLLASRGEWQQAYQHLRSALDLVYSDRIEQPPVPEQLRREVDRLRREHAEAREQSIRDSLTASYNRRYLDQRLTSLLAETSRRSTAGLAVALVDLDWFKQVNDTFGHLVGDRVLQRVVDLLSDGLPDGAFCARYGGEEFVLVVPGHRRQVPRSRSPRPRGPGWNGTPGRSWCPGSGSRSASGSRSNRARRPAADQCRATAAAGGWFAVRGQAVGPQRGRLSQQCRPGAVRRVRRTGDGLPNPGWWRLLLSGES